MFWKKKSSTNKDILSGKGLKPLSSKTRLGQVEFGLEVKRCASCQRYTRPCMVSGKPAIFHRWADEDKALLRINTFLRPEDQLKIVEHFRDEGVCDARCSTEKVHQVLALVEYADGSVDTVPVQTIRFIDKEV